MPERDRRGEGVGGCRDGDEARDALGMEHRGTGRLHPAERASHCRVQLVHVQMIEQRELCGDHVLDRKEREIRAKAPARLRVDRRRPRGAIAAAEVVGADDVEEVGVQGAAGSDELLPPAR